MAIPSGLSNQLGYAQQSDYVTVATATRFLEFVSESLNVDKQVLRSRSIGDQFQRSGRTRHYIKGAAGDISIPFMNKGMGLLLKHALGSVSTAHIGSTAEYQHTFTPASDGGAGDYLTIQKGLADNTGTVRPFNFIGGKVLTWELVQELDANLIFNLGFDFKTAQTTTGLAVASYPAALTPLSFVDAVLTVDTVEVCTRSLRVGGNRALDVDRRCLGNTKREPVANGENEITGTILREFEGTAQYDAWIAGTPAALVATWQYGEVEADGEPFQLVITLPEIEYTGNMPQANGSAIVMQELPFKALYNGTDPIVSILYATTDATP